MSNSFGKGPGSFASAGAAAARPRRVGVIFGGASGEREVSLRSGAAVASALEARGYDVVRIEAKEPLSALAPEVLLARIDVAFLALHGRLGEDGCVQGLLELLRIPYTGSGVLASALAMDKLKAKELFRLHNVPTPPYYVIHGRSGLLAGEAAQASFGYPVVVKPRGEGSSLGVAKAGSPDELRRAVSAAFELDDSVLVERFVAGAEVHVGILDGRALGTIEIVPRNGMFDFAAKYTPGMTEYFVPARLSPARAKGVLHLAERAVSVLGCSGAARVDLLVTPGENEYVLEVNTLPGLTETSLLPKIAAAAGLSFGDLCEAMLRSARLHASAAARRAAPARRGSVPGVTPAPAVAAVAARKAEPLLRKHA
jgi:D-alanine-D-alanine ligase